MSVVVPHTDCIGKGENNDILSMEKCYHVLLLRIHTFTYEYIKYIHSANIDVPPMDNLQERGVCACIQFEESQIRDLCFSYCSFCH